jgi:hypothetical protein
MPDLIANSSERVILGMALCGIITAPLYLLARYNSAICTALSFFGLWGGWSGTLAAAYAAFREGKRIYLIAFCVGLVGSIFWGWAIYDFNVLKYRH